MKGHLWNVFCAIPGWLLSEQATSAALSCSSVSGIPIASPQKRLVGKATELLISCSLFMFILGVLRYFCLGAGTKHGGLWVSSWIASWCCVTQTEILDVHGQVQVSQSACQNHSLSSSGAPCFYPGRSASCTPWQVSPMDEHVGLLEN